MSSSANSPSPGANPDFDRERVIRHSITVSAGVEEVWQAWTTSSGIRSFMAPEAEVELRVDGPFRIFFDPLAPAGSRGADDMLILAFQAGQMLAFTWNAPPHLPEVRRQRTHVVVRFAVINGTETKVTLHHDGWGTGGEWDLAFAYFSQAWPRVLASLKERFIEGPVDWSGRMEQLRQYHAQSPKP